MVRRPLFLRLLLLCCGLALAGTALVATPSTAEPGPLPDQASDRARAALAKVEAMLSGTTTANAGGGESLTMAMKDLAILQGDLTGDDLAAARALLARPTDKPANCSDVRCYRGKSKRTCSSVVCVHWVPKSRDRVNGVSRADADDDGKPNYVEQVLASTSDVHQTYVDSGYRETLPDGKRGGNAKPDIYLSQIGDVGYYGYCTTDDPKFPPHGATWAYCVLDNDYKEFPFHTPLQNMRVTAAHEYFHAVQFAYDIGEDNWFMEATATWAEDALFDNINDNAFYLSSGPIRHPKTSIDTFSGLYHYGAWVFIRYLTDRHGGTQGSMADLVLRTWDLLPGKAGYSLDALETVLGEEGTTLTEEVAEFSAGNRRPQVTYAEEYQELKGDGIKETKYPTAPLQASLKLGLASGEVTENFRLDHLTAGTVRFTPRDSLAGDGMGLSLDFDVNDTAAGGAVVVTVKEVGSPATSELRTLQPDGTGNAFTGFDPETVSWVEVTLVNASDRFDCWQGNQTYSCRGNSLDDNQQQVVQAEVQVP